MKRRRRRTRLTPELLERMEELRRRGLTYAEIAGKLGVAFQTVAGHMRRIGLGNRRTKVTEEVLDEMVRLREEGMTYREIAGRFGLSTMTVCNYLRKRPGPIERLRRRLGLG